MRLAVKTQRLITPLQELRNGVVLIDGENIESVGLQANTPIPADCEVWDVGDRIVAPGLIDIHNHGANGHFAREGAQAVHEVSKWLATTGTTSWLCNIGDVEGVPVGPTTQREFGAPYRKAAFSALANVRGARLRVELRPWQEALAEHLQTSRSDSGAAAPATQVN